MKKSWLVFLMIAAMVVPGVALSQVETSMGTIQLGGKIKWAYMYMPEDEASVGAGTAGQAWGLDGKGIEQFSTPTVELDIVGTVGENVSYLIELQAGPATSMMWMSNPGEMGTVGVRQAKISIADLIPMTTVDVGTFNLPVSTYQQRETNDWDLIMLPLMNVLPNQGGNAYMPLGLGWQATGFDIAIKPMDMVQIDFAYFNGFAGGQPNLDVDLEKSWMAGIKVFPMEGMNVEFTWLQEGWQEDLMPGLVGDTSGTGTEQYNASGFVVTLGYAMERFEINADYMQMTASDYTLNAAGNKIEDLEWMGYQVTAGYWIIDSLEIAARYEYFDPNTLNEAGSVNNYDALDWITLGANYRINECAEASINYIFAGEEGSDINMAANNVGGKFQSLDNDMLLIQVQVWQ